MGEHVQRCFERRFAGGSIHSITIPTNILNRKGVMPPRPDPQWIHRINLVPRNGFISARPNMIR